jgi:hypothetical protein
MATRTETVDNNETITIHARLGLGNAVAAKLLVSGITDGTSNTIMFAELVHNPAKLQSGFGLLLPASYAMGRYRAGMTVPVVQLLPYMEQDNVRKGASVNGLQAQALVTEVTPQPGGLVAVWLKPQQGIIAILIGL